MHPDESPSRRSNTKRARIAQALAEDIGRGDFAEGAALPTEGALATRFGVSRQTLRFALSDLRSRGLVQSRQGVGTTVARRHAVPEFSHSFQTIDELVGYTKSSTGRTVADTELVLTPAMAARIGTQPGVMWRRITTVRTAIGHKVPIAFNNTWLPREHAEAFQVARDSGLPVFVELQRLSGKPITKVLQVCGATLATKTQARHLQCGVHEALLEIKRWYHAADDSLLGLSETWHPPSRFQFSVTLRRAPL